MRKQAIKISALSALAIALVISATMLYAGGSRTDSAQYSAAQVNDSTMQAAVYHPGAGNELISGYRPVMFANRRRVYYDANGNVVRTSNGEPVRYRRRSKKKSALIVGGAAATGAVIGGLAKGGKGAAIGALAGGATGLVYDRATVNKKQ